MRDMIGACLIAAGEHHTLVFAWGQVHPFIVLVNLDWILRPNFGTSATGNVEQMRIRMREPQTALFNAVAEDHRVQSHADSYSYCVLFPGRLKVYQRAHLTRADTSEERTGASFSPALSGMVLEDFAVELINVAY